MGGPRGPPPGFGGPPPGAAAGAPAEVPVIELWVETLAGNYIFLHWLLAQ